MWKRFGYLAEAADFQILSFAKHICRQKLKCHISTRCLSTCVLYTSSIHGTRLEVRDQTQELAFSYNQVTVTRMRSRIAASDESLVSPH
jgi:hypothetical protein